MGLNLGLSFFIHLMIVLTMFLYEFFIELRKSPGILYVSIILAIILEMLYFFVQTIILQ